MQDFSPAMFELTQYEIFALWYAVFTSMLTRTFFVWKAALSLGVVQSQLQGLCGRLVVHGSLLVLDHGWASSLLAASWAPNLQHWHQTPRVENMETAELILRFLRFFACKLDAKGNCRLTEPCCAPEKYQWWEKHQCYNPKSVWVQCNIVPSMFAYCGDSFHSFTTRVLKSVWRDNLSSLCTPYRGNCWLGYDTLGTTTRVQFAQASLLDLASRAARELNPLALRSGASPDVLFMDGFSFGS